MDPRHLVQLAVILEKGSITQASHHLHLTQPTLTHNMQVLEMQVGGTLFERSRFGVRSTPLGEVLAREGRAIARRLKDAAEVAAQHKSGLTSQVRIGTGPLVGAALSPGLIAHLEARFPGLALTVQSDRPHALVEQLVDGHHDFVIAPAWLDHPPPGIERELLVEDELRVYCGPTHPLAGRPWDPAAANNCDWVSLGTASPFTREVREMLTAAGLKSTRTTINIVGETFVLLGLLAQGRHLAVLPRFPIQAMRAHFPLVELPLPVAPTRRPIYLWNRAQLMETPGMATLKQAILDHGLAQDPPAPQPGNIQPRNPRPASKRSTSKQLASKHPSKQPTSKYPASKQPTPKPPTPKPPTSKHAASTPPPTKRPVSTHSPSKRPPATLLPAAAAIPPRTATRPPSPPTRSPKKKAPRTP